MTKQHKESKIIVTEKDSHLKDALLFAKVKATILKESDETIRKTRELQKALEELELDEFA